MLDDRAQHHSWSSRISPVRPVPCRNSAQTTASGVTARAVTGMVDHVLELAATWTHWDGEPAHADGRIHTPHKAIHRVADPLAEARSRLTRLARIRANRLGPSPTTSSTTRPAKAGAFANSPCASRDRRPAPTRWVVSHDPAHSARR